MTASANVVGTCKVTMPPGVLNFGVIDPSGTTTTVASTTFAMKCTKSVVSTAATDDGGLNSLGGVKRMQHSAVPTAFLPYTLTYSGDTGFVGQGFGPTATAATVTVTGTVAPADYQNALVTAAGQTYNDVVTVTVNP